MLEHLWLNVWKIMTKLTLSFPILGYSTYFVTNWCNYIWLPSSGYRNYFKNRENIFLFSFILLTVTTKLNLGYTNHLFRRVLICLGHLRPRSYGSFLVLLDSICWQRYWIGEFTWAFRLQGRCVRQLFDPFLWFRILLSLGASRLPARTKRSLPRILSSKYTEINIFLYP